MEAVQVCHELWSENEDNRVSRVDTSHNFGLKIMKQEDEQFDNALTLGGHRHLGLIREGNSDSESKEDEAAAPIWDKPVSWEV